MDHYYFFLVIQPNVEMFSCKITLIFPAENYGTKIIQLTTPPGPPHYRFLLPRTILRWFLSLLSAGVTARAGRLVQGFVVRDTEATTPLEVSSEDRRAKEANM